MLSFKMLVILLKNCDVNRLNGDSRLNLLVKSSKMPESPACVEHTIFTVIAGIIKERSF